MSVNCQQLMSDHHKHSLVLSLLTHSNRTFHSYHAIVIIIIIIIIRALFGVLEHGSSYGCFPLLLCISVCAVSVDVLTHAVDLHKTASR